MFGRLIVRRLETSIIKTNNKVDRLSEHCPKHNIDDHSHADACPCQAELFWKLDRLDESIYRLTAQRQWVLYWWIWYIRSSPRWSGFPKESVRCWSQTDQPIAAWEKYSTPKRNGEVSPNHQRAYIYYRGSRERSTRPVAAINSE